MSTSCDNNLILSENAEDWSANSIGCAILAQGYRTSITIITRDPTREIPNYLS